MIRRTGNTVSFFAESVQRRGWCWRGSRRYAHPRIPSRPVGETSGSARQRIAAGDGGRSGPPGPPGGSSWTPTPPSPRHPPRGGPLPPLLPLGPHCGGSAAAPPALAASCQVRLAVCLITYPAPPATGTCVRSAGSDGPLQGRSRPPAHFLFIKQNRLGGK
jgi:hypothetical protein